MTYLIVGIVTLYGLLIGSAINAIVWRLHVGKSWVKGRSMCPDCRHELAAKDLVPVFSWLYLRGLCRYCKKAIHWQYPVVELMTALLFGMSAFALHPQNVLGWFQFALWLIALTMMIILAVYDLRWMLLPFKVSWPLIGVGIIYVVSLFIAGSSVKVLLGPVEAAIAAGIVFQVLSMMKVKSSTLMGGGDVFLVVAMGLFLGLQRTLLALILAFNVAAVLSLLMIVLKFRKRDDNMIPFGPYLIGGTIIAFLYGSEIISWYLRLNGLQI